MMEFAFTFAIFVLLFIGFLGLAIIFFGWLTTTSAAHEGMHYIVANPSTATQAKVEKYICDTSVMLGGSTTACNNLLASGDLKVTPEPSCTTAPCTAYQPYAQVSVLVEYRVSVPTLRITFLGGSNLTFLGPVWVHSKAIARIDP